MVVATCGFCGWTCVGKDLWLDLPDGAPVIRMHVVPGPPTKQVFGLPDGSLLRWTLDDRLVHGRSEARFKNIRNVAVFKKRKQVAVLTEDGLISVGSIFDLKSLFKVELAQPGSEFLPPYNIAISPDESRFASEDKNGFIVEWDSQSGRVVNRTSVKADRIYEVDYDPDGSLWATLDDDSPFRQRTVLVGGQARARPLDILHFDISDDGRFICQKWEVDVGGTGWSAIQSPDRHHVALSMSGNTGPWTGGRTAIVDSATGKNLVWLRHPARPMSEIAWWKGRLVVGGSYGYLGLFDRETGRRDFAFTGPKNNIDQLHIIEGRLFAVDETGTVMTCKSP